jgi:hypothetical protein
MPPERKSKVSNYERKHYGMFVGKTIANVQLAEFEPGFDMIPVFHFTDGTFMQIMADPAGNGPGWASLHTSEGHEIVPDNLKTGDFKKT